jgi:crotonobetaine/carnitine-CoA ligase
VRDGFHARLIDDEGRDVPPGTIGELIVRSDERIVMSLGYQGDAAATEEAWRDGWYHTGDAVSVDEDGFYYFHDRYKDSLRRRGENISSFEVEREVLAFPGIDEVACVAHPGEYAGDDEVKVFIVPEPGRQIHLPEVVEFLGERLPAFMQPRYLELADALPKTPTSRVRKHLLRDQGNTGATYDRLSARA